MVRFQLTDEQGGQDQLIQRLKDGNPVLARISVNGDDRITTVKEIYRP
ncbi:hypothetical protein [Amycolatopsis pittospori]|nr:hypothetical protein [Amycolatopsis pittospori]